jgi:muconolactone delta-isomerase
LKIFNPCDLINFKKITIMKKFMLDIKLEGLDTETRMSLLPREQELVKEMEENGTIVNNFIKLDMSGIYIVMMASDIDDVHAKLATLPYYPYMKIVIVPVRVVNHINQ